MKHVHVNKEQNNLASQGKRPIKGAHCVNQVYTYMK